MRHIFKLSLLCVCVSVLYQLPGHTEFKTRIITVFLVSILSRDIFILLYEFSHLGVWHLFNDHCLWLQHLGNRSNGLVNVTQSDCMTVGRGRRATIVAVAIGQFEFHTPGCNCKSKMLSLSLDSMCYRLFCLFSASVTPQAAVELQLQLSHPFITWQLSTYCINVIY